MSSLKRPRDLELGDVIETSTGTRRTVRDVHVAHPAHGWRPPGGEPVEAKPTLIVRFTDGTSLSLDDTDEVLRVW